MDNLTKEQRRKNMQSIKSKDSKIEISLAKALWARGHRYRKNDKKVFGKPDITMKKYKIAIFVDGEFWHGKNWNKRQNGFKSNKKYWIKKIEKNILRDKKVNLQLRKNGWNVLRFWGERINSNLESCIKKIEKIKNEIVTKNKN